MTTDADIRVGLFSDAGAPLREFDWFTHKVRGEDRNTGDDAELARNVVESGKVPPNWLMLTMAGRAYVIAWTDDLAKRVVFDSRLNDGRYDAPEPGKPEPRPALSTILFRDMDGKVVDVSQIAYTTCERAYRRGREAGAEEYAFTVVGGAEVATDVLERGAFEADWRKLLGGHRIK